MGAGGAAMRIMDQRMYNDMRNKTNRLSNCETANISKSVMPPCRCSWRLKSCRRPGR